MPPKTYENGPESYDSRPFSIVRSAEQQQLTNYVVISDELMVQGPDTCKRTNSEYVPDARCNRSRHTYIADYYSCTGGKYPSLPKKAEYDTNDDDGFGSRYCHRSST